MADETDFGKSLSLLVETQLKCTRVLNIRQERRLIDCHDSGSAPAFAMFLGLRERHFLRFSLVCGRLQAALNFN